MKSYVQTEARLPNPQDWRSITQAAEEIGIAKPTVWDLIRAKKLKTYRIGSLTVLWADDVRAYAEAYRTVKG